MRTTFLPNDETCFHLFEAHSIELVDEVSRRAGLGHARIVPARGVPIHGSVEAMRTAGASGRIDCALLDRCCVDDHSGVDRVVM